MAGQFIDRFQARVMAPASELSVYARGADLIVPSDERPRLVESACIDRKDTHECRRAAAVALPSLEKTESAAVLEIAAIDERDAARARVDDVVAWPERHGVMAEGHVERSNGRDVDQLQRAADERHATVIGADDDGHGRLREWVVGRVTRDLLLDSKHGVLASH